MFKNYKLQVRLLVLFLAVFLTVSVSCSSDKTVDKSADKAMEKTTAVTDAKPKTKALDTGDMDLTVRPGDDFYLYANGNWLKNNPVPDEYSRWGSFEQLRERNLKDLRTILEEAQQDKDAPEGSIVRKIGDFYSVAMDETKIEADGLKPLEEELKRIADIKDKKQFQEVTALFHTYRVAPLFFLFESQDPGNSEIVIAWLYQGGLGLPDRDYYTEDQERQKKIREEYVKHVTKMFELLGDTPGQAEKAARTVMAIETQLAKASMTRVELRNPKATYNRKTVEELDQMTPDFDFAAFFKAIGLPNPGNLNVAQPKFFQEVSNVIGQTSLEDLKTFLRWNLVSSTAPYLSKAFVEEDFRFNRGILTGAKKMQPRWKRALNTTSGAMGEALGQIYVKKHFPPEAKTRMYNLVMTLKEVLGERIKKLEWMGAETKEKALAKLAAFKVKIGYPDRWIDYTPLEIKRDSYVKNVQRASIFEFNRRLKRIGKPPDRTQWQMTPQTVNAYYHPLLNEIVFPAAILQPPFFYFEADDALNYGAIGAAIGHEMTHGYDDQGRQYDKDGNLKDWWTKEDEEKFKARADLMEKQYDGYVAVDDVHVNGKLTLGENIADLGGLHVAYDGLMRALAKEGKTDTKIDGFTPQQRFFLAWARVWRNNITKENLLLRVKTDPHSPGRFRSIGPLVNMPQFYEAFGVKEGEKLFKAEKERIKIW
jgi:putative endopeptidase